MTYDEAIRTIRALVRYAMTHSLLLPATADDVAGWMPPNDMIAAAMDPRPGAPAPAVPAWGLEHGDHPLSAPPQQPGPCLVELTWGGRDTWLWSWWDGADWRGVYDGHDACVAVAHHEAEVVIRPKAGGRWRGTVTI